MKTAVLVLAGVLAGTVASAQAPRVANARLQPTTVAGAFDAFFDGLVQRQVSAAWIGYAVPAIPGRHLGCCGSGDSFVGAGPCYLEGRPSTVAGEDRAVKLEGDSHVLVLFRVENRKVGRIAVFSPDCELDAGGLPFFSLAGVAPADSVRLLTTLARAADSSDRVARGAVMAIALHGDGSADRALEQTVAAGQPIEVRKQTAFWLGTARGERGYEILRAAVEHDSSVEFRKQATFAFSQSPVAAAIDTLIQMAKTDTDASVRGQALFWIAQKAGKKAAGVITTAITDDPDAQVKERAVFALSQLPKDEGVPLLIGVARANRDPRIRQRAMFWLGQSKDPRALAFFEEVLKAR